MQIDAIFQNSLRAAGAVLFLLLGCMSTPLHAEEAGYFSLQPIAPRTYAAIVAPGQRAGANAGVVVGDDAVAVIDSFFDPAAARELLAEIRKITPLPVRYVINTHYHIDHVAGNSIFREAGALIVAHPQVRAWQRSENRKFFGDSIKDELRALIDALPAAAIETDTHLRLDLGGRVLEVRSYPGHTGTDLVVRVADARTVFCGDLFWNRALPNLIDARSDQWLTTLGRLPQNTGATHFVPGHGPLGDAADLKTFQTYLHELRHSVADGLQNKQSDADLQTALLPTLKNRYGEWRGFPRMAESNVRDMAAELRGSKRYPGNARAEAPADATP